MSTSFDVSSYFGVPNYRRDFFGFLFRHLAISGLLAVDIFRFLEGLSNQALRRPTVPVLLVLRLLLFSSVRISIELRLAVPSLIAIAFSVIVDSRVPLGSFLP